MKFYLGTHEPSWLATVAVPLMVSRRRLETRPFRGQANTPWVLDSGGFTELDTTGTWGLTPNLYAARVRRWADEIGRLEWAAPQDWMCEPRIRAVTGLTVAEHQKRTVSNYLDLCTLWPDGPFIPVLQGWEPDDYMKCWELYDKAGIDLEQQSTVGLGSVCRRQATGEAEQIVHQLQPLRLHGFGMKTTAFAMFGALLESADSLAWSLGGRRRGTCTHLKSKCANHLHWALDWRNQILSPDKPSLFGIGV